MVSVSGALLAACGGGQAGSAAPEPTAIAAALTNVTLQPVAPALLPAADVITDVKFESTQAAGAVQTNVPVTFGQVFARGNVLATNSLIGQLVDGTIVPLQMDVKATHPDGSLRHVVLSALLPSLAAGETRVVTIGKKVAPSLTAKSAPTSMLNAGFSSKVSLTLGNETYSASADELLKTAAYKTWLTGAISNEWIVSAPLKRADGEVHPHLTARFAVRWYNAIKKARVDVTIENAWAYEAAPQNFTYDALVLVGGKKVYEKAALTHFHHSRWRKLFWWGDAPQVHVKHNTAYLITSKAVPNFDQGVVISSTALATMGTEWTGAKTEPMGVGTAVPYMPGTGGRPDMGLLPSWAATYLLSMDKRAKQVALGTADLAGSWSIHYRNKITDRPISLFDFPYMTIVGRDTDTVNPVTRKAEAFPVCATTNGCNTPYVQDTAHQPGFAYLPYVVTGDYYYLEELQFWAMYNSFSSNPGYRGNIMGLVTEDQVRAQGWSLRTLSEAAYITPDNDPLKTQFEFFLSSNFDWYLTNYVNNPAANSLGMIVHSYAIGYENGTALSPWMDDFFTSAVGHAAELGYAKAKTILMWKAQSPIDRMTGPGACWIDAAIYNLKVRDSVTSPLYTTIGKAYSASHTAEFNALACAGSAMASALQLQTREMTGYSAMGTGFPSNMQPALAYSADSGRTGGATAWSIFASRSVKPDYSVGPQFAIVPRK